MKALDIICFAMLMWAVVCIIIALSFKLCGRKISLNPLEWLPFYVIAPIAFSILVLVYIFIFPIMGLIQTFGFIHWSNYAISAELENDSVILSKNGSFERRISWKDILEWHQIKSHPFPIYQIYLKTNELVRVDILDIDSFAKILDKHDIPLLQKPYTC